MIEVEIPDYNVERLEGLIKKLTARAARCGVAAPTLEILGERLVELDEDGEAEVRTLTLVKVRVDGETPSLDGWAMIAVIERDLHGPADAMNTVAVLPNVDEAGIDKGWWTVGDRCDHTSCNGVARGRKKLVVVEHADHGRKIIGTTCLADFLGGVDPASVAAALGYVEGMAELAGIGAGDWGEDGGGPRYDLRYNAAWVLAMTGAVVDECGWVSKGSAWEYDRTATADVVRHQLMDRRTLKPNERIEPSDGHFDEADKCFTWMLNLELGDDSSYLNNLAALASQELWKSDHFGIGCSALVSYRRATEKMLRRQLEREGRADSEWVGAPKDRLEIEADVVFVKEFPGDFGTRTMVKLVDDAGNRMVWWATKKAPQQGDRVVGRATVKKHGEYDGTKETTVTRMDWHIDPDVCHHNHGTPIGSDRQLWPAEEVKTGKGREKTSVWVRRCARCLTAFTDAEILGMLDAKGLVVKSLVASGFQQHPRYEVVLDRWRADGLAEPDNEAESLVELDTAAV